ncbi:hypothetical protein VT50_0234490 [Streptomyces antioxidans]|uniref:Oligopeptide/dipeptide ABC transporter C-terminal domain-containing protein n=1 Tax=Streptomyces antioxidans TaxID=1507734 RepID=A0A1V4CV69_9ACTN|nr:oligopeptide/dipeptide ABC transporter ATP-binding protein [Streptomyces antioxidans]OPF71370.1 hypothetical protein VT50_0234490 [Streptomyces antioxidans]
MLNDPLHPYTEALLRVATVGGWERRDLEVIPGAPPEVGARLPGCRFADRCAFAALECLDGPVPLRDLRQAAGAMCPRRGARSVADKWARVPGGGGMSGLLKLSG